MPKTRDSFWNSRTTKAAEHLYMSNLCRKYSGLDYILDSNVLKWAYWLWSLKLHDCLWTFIPLPGASWRWWRRWVSHHETRPEMNLFTLEMCNWLCAPALSRTTSLIIIIITMIIIIIISLLLYFLKCAIGSALQPSHGQPLWWQQWRAWWCPWNHSWWQFCLQSSGLDIYTDMQ